MTQDERLRIDAAIAEYDRLSNERDDYSELHRIIKEWDFYSQDISRALNSLIGGDEARSYMLTRLLINAITRDALFSALESVIKDYDKQIDAI